jgi:hypothetical protein
MPAQIEREHPVAARGLRQPLEQRIEFVPITVTAVDQHRDRGAGIVGGVKVAGQGSPVGAGECRRFGSGRG